MTIKNVTLRSAWRTKWLWLMFVILGAIFVYSPMNSEPRLVAHKLLIGVCAFIVGHIATKSLYDYISLSTLLDKDKFNELPDGVKFVGACILRGLIMSAFILGVMLGI